MQNHSARRGAAMLTAANLLSQLLAFFYRMALSRMIGPEGMGLFQLIFPFLSLFMAVAVSGICVSVSRLGAEYRALGDYGSLRLLVRRALLLFFSVFAGMALLSVCFSEKIAEGFLGDPRTRLAVLLLIPEIFFTGIENIHKHYLYGVGETAAPAVSDVMEQLVRISSVLLLLMVCRPGEPEQVLGLIAFGMCLCEIVSACFLRLVYRSGRKNMPDMAPKRSAEQITGQIIRTAVPVSASSFVNNLLSALIVVLIPRRLEASGLTHSQALEEYGVLFGMTLPLLMLPTALIFGIGLVIVPKLSERLALGDEEGVRQLISRSIGTASLLILPVLAVMVPLGRPLVQMLYRAEVDGSLFLPLAAAAALSIYMGLFGSILNGLGRPGAAAFGSITGNALELLLVWVLIGLPELRMKGYIIAFLASVILTAGFDLGFVIHACKVQPKPIDWFLLPLLCSAAAALTARLTLTQMAAALGDRGAMGLAVFFAMAIYAVLMLLRHWGLGKEGRFDSRDK